MPSGAWKNGISATSCEYAVLAAHKISAATTFVAADLTVRTVPGGLAAVARIPTSDAVNAGDPRAFELNANPFGINGKRMDMTVIDERIRLGDTEVWEITNPNNQAHPFHAHGDSFQVLSRDGASPQAHELGWKDVVLVRPFETVRIIKRFHDYADPASPYMFHCHILEHEDVGMMGQFVVEH